MKILGLIPARGGSKGIPRKNIKPIAGKPLIAWTIEAALKSSQLSTVVVSTEDSEIGEVARLYGALTPFVRPSKLAQDDTPGIDPVLHALSAMPEFDAVVLLQPTSPLRTSADIDDFVSFALNKNASCVMSVTEADKHPYWMYSLEEGVLRPVVAVREYTRRQDLPPVYAANGALYFARSGWLKQNRTFISPETMGFVMPRERSLDIDTIVDWKLAEMLLRSGS